MRSLLICPLMALSCLRLIAQPTLETPALEGAAATARQAAIDRLLSERESLTAFDLAIAEARKNTISEQAILEAKFLYHVDHFEDDAIAKLLPEFLKMNESFKLENSVIFSVKEDWLAVVEYVRAIDSIKQGDAAAFKNHITEAFWLSPKQATAFAPQIDKIRLDEAMRSVKIDFSRQFKALSNGNTTELSSLIKDHKAMLFHFWSPRSRDCESILSDFMATLTALNGKNIAAVSFVSGENEKFATEASAILKPLSSTLSGSWLVDDQTNPLSRELRIQEMPQVVIIATEGSVLYNGSPGDDGFWAALQKIDSRIIRPEINVGGE
jgi:hypothetical protein